MNDLTDEERAEKYPGIHPEMRPYVWQPGQSGNPLGRQGAKGWRQKLEHVFGDGEALFGAMYQLATGNILYIEDPGAPGQPPDKKKWIRIEPNGYMMVSAFQALRDTLIGKPVSVQIDHFTHTESGTKTTQLLDGLNSEDIAALKLLAKKAATVMRHQKSRALAPIREIPDTAKQDDPSPSPE